MYVKFGWSTGPGYAKAAAAAAAAPLVLYCPSEQNLTSSLLRAVVIQEIYVDLFSDHVYDLG